MSTIHLEPVTKCAETLQIFAVDCVCGSFLICLIDGFECFPLIFEKVKPAPFTPFRYLLKLLSQSAPPCFAGPV